MAAFLLSRLAFVAQPISVGDDIGVDFFCTRFDRTLSRSPGEQTQLEPRASFAIQIKSSAKPIHVKDGSRIRFLTSLGLPLFVGVVNQRYLRMDLYSAELLPLVVPLVGVPSRLRLRLLQGNEPTSKSDWESGCKNMPAEVPCQHVGRLDATDPEDVTEQVGILIDRISHRVATNISSKANEEHFYQFGQSGSPYLMAGPGSARTFRVNMLRRLWETLFNLERLAKHDPKDFDIGEQEAYLQLSRTLLPMYVKRPELSHLCEEIGYRFTAKDSQSGRSRKRNLQQTKPAR